MSAVVVTVPTLALVLPVALLVTVLWSRYVAWPVVRWLMRPMERGIELGLENVRLRLLVDDLGEHLTALVNHPANYARRYDVETGAPCAGCYDARDAYLAWKEQDA